MKKTGIDHPLLDDLLSAVTPAQGDWFSGLLTDRSFREGEPLFREGDVGDEMFFILTGSAAVHKKSGFGGKTKVVALLADGSLAGEAAMTGESVHTAAVVAVRDCTTLTLKRSDFAQLEDEHPALALQLLKRILKITSMRLQKSSERLALVL